MKKGNFLVTLNGQKVVRYMQITRVTRMQLECDMYVFLKSRIEEGMRTGIYEIWQKWTVEAKKAGTCNSAMARKALKS